MYGTLLLSLAVGVGAQTEATQPTQDALALLRMMDRQASIRWSDYRFLRPQTADERLGVRAMVASLNATSDRLEDVLIEISDDLWAVNLQRIGWPAAAWEEMSKGWVYYTSLPNDLKAALKARTGSEAPLMRADVFLKDGWTSKWYSTFMKLPQNRNDYLKANKVIQNDRFAMGVISKGIAVHPGKVARFETEDGRAVWIRMQYLDTKGQNNCSENPEVTACDYNEIQMELPSGLLAFSSWEGRTGKLSLFGDTRIAQDTRAEDKDGVAIELGASCFRCHNEGQRYLKHADNVDLSRVSLKNRKAFSRDRLAEFATKDRERYRANYERIIKAKPEEVTAAINRVLKKFEVALDLNTVASEVGVSVADLRERLPFTNNRLAKKLVQGSPLTRQEFEDAYPAIVAAFGDDDRRAFRGR